MSGPLFDLTATCLGFYFLAFVPDGTGRPREVEDAPDFAEARDRFLQRVRDVLAGRTDLLDALNCLNEGLEVRLHCGPGFFDEEGQSYFYGRVTREVDTLVLELATDEVLGGVRPGHEALDVVVHELTHVLDMMDEPLGQLPFQTTEQRASFARLRERERQAMADGSSALDAYALTDDKEFLAVAVETFFAKSAALAESSPALWGYLNDYFLVDPGT